MFIRKSLTIVLSLVLFVPEAVETAASRDYLICPGSPCAIFPIERLPFTPDGGPHSPDRTPAVTSLWSTTVTYTASAGMLRLAVDDLTK